MIVKQDFLGCLFLFCLSVAVSFGVNAVSPDGIPIIGQWDRDKGVVMAGSNSSKDAEVVQINNPLKAKQMVDAGEYIIIDVRWPEIYVEGHIPGAVNFPLEDIETGKQALQKLIQPEDKILAYCAGVTCSDSHTFAEHLIEMGFVHVAVYAGGFSEWQEMGFEVAFE